MVGVSGGVGWGITAHSELRGDGLIKGQTGKREKKRKANGGSKWRGGVGDYRTLRTEGRRVDKGSDWKEREKRKANGGSKWRGGVGDEG